MSVSVIAPCFNEIFYVKAWLSNALKFGDGIIVLDTGSTDGSYEWLMEQKFRELKVLRGFETKQRFVWDEEDIRNCMLAAASGDVILAYDFIEKHGNYRTGHLLAGGRLEKWEKWHHTQFTVAYYYPKSDTFLRCFIRSIFILSNHAIEYF